MAGKKSARKSKQVGFSLGALLLAAPLFLVSAVQALEEPPPMVEEKFDLFSAPSTRDELLLFWEEKDLYVTTATRTSKPLFQTPENLVVVTAREIEEMNAHTLAEVLNSVPGLFVEQQGQDFGSPALFHIQGSEIRHVTVLIDGFAMNGLVDGNAMTWLIPPKIIERIEILKGPASSAWGSALGGVISVITKNGGDTVLPRGAISGSIGEGNSRDFGAELTGKAGPASYFLYAGKQRSNGIRYEGFDMESFYGKVNLRVSNELELQFTAGYTDPEINTGSLPAANLITRVNTRGAFATASLDYRLTTNWSLKGGLHLFDQAVNIPTYRYTTGAFIRETRNDETIWGGNLRLVYQGDLHAAVAGFEFSRGSSDLVIAQAVAPVNTSPEIEKWAFFVNDTLPLGKFSFIPGLRFDRNDISGSFISPSLGMTYVPVEHTILRASVARGFTTPPLSYMSGGGRNLDPNPGLKEENVWSYQAGVESGLLEYVLARVNLFRHDMEDSLVKVATQAPRGMYVNGGDVTRQGVEAGFETAPLYNLSLKGSVTYVHVRSEQKPSDRDKNSWTNNSYNLGLKYDNRSLMAQLTGTSVWWDSPAAYGAKYDDIIWDLNASKKIFDAVITSGEIFATVHNLTNSSYYALFTYPNPRRWVEAGIRVKF